MSTIGDMLVRPNALATSALPNSPVLEERERAPRGATRAAIATALRGTAGAIRRLADHVEPSSRLSAA